MANVPQSIQEVASTIDHMVTTMASASDEDKMISVLFRLSKERNPASSVTWRFKEWVLAASSPLKPIKTDPQIQKFLHLRAHAQRWWNLIINIREDVRLSTTNRQMIRGVGWLSSYEAARKPWILRLSEGASGSSFKDRKVATTDTKSRDDFFFWRFSSARIDGGRDEIENGVLNHQEKQPHHWKTPIRRPLGNSPARNPH